MQPSVATNSLPYLKINISTFYNALARLRQKACQIPERETNTDTFHDLTVKALSDVVPVSIIPETKTGLSADPALQDAAVRYDNSHMVQITTGNLSMLELIRKRSCSGADQEPRQTGSHASRNGLCFYCRVGSLSEVLPGCSAVSLGKGLGADGC